MQSVFLYRFFDEAKLFSAFYLAIEPARFAQIAPAFYFVVFHFSKYTLVNYQAWISLAKIHYFLRSAQTHRRQSAATVAGVALARGRSLFFPCWQAANDSSMSRRCIVCCRQTMVCCRQTVVCSHQTMVCCHQTIAGGCILIHYQTIQVYKSQRLQGRLQSFPRRRKRLPSPILCPRS